MAEWYYIENGQQQGPVSVAQMQQKALTEPGTMVWKAGLTGWTPISQVPELAPQPPPVPPHLAVPGTPPPPPMATAPYSAASPQRFDPGPVSLIPEELHAPLEPDAMPEQVLDVGRMNLFKCLSRGYDVFCMYDWKAMFMVITLMLVGFGLLILGTVISYNNYYLGIGFFLFIQGYFLVGIWAAAIGFADRDYPRLGVIFPSLHHVLLPGFASLLVYGLMLAGSYFLGMILLSPEVHAAKLTFPPTEESGKILADYFEPVLIYSIANQLMNFVVMSLFFFWPGLITDKEKPALAAVAGTLRYTLPNIISIFFLILILSFIMALGTCFLIIGLIPAAAYAICTAGVAFRQIVPKTRKKRRR